MESRNNGAGHTLSHVSRCLVQMVSGWSLKVPKVNVFSLPKISSIPDFCVLGGNFLWGEGNFFNIKFK